MTLGTCLGFEHPSSQAVLRQLLQSGAGNEEMMAILERKLELVGATLEVRQRFNGGPEIDLNASR